VGGLDLLRDVTGRQRPQRGHRLHRGEGEVVASHRARCRTGSAREEPRQLPCIVRPTSMRVGEEGARQVAADRGAEIEREAVEMVRELRAKITIPIAVKLSPFHTSLPHFAAALQDAGADGLVLFNRFFEPDIDIENLEVITEMRLSDSHEVLLRLRWLAILSGLLNRTQVAVTGGVHTAVDAIKAVMCGASGVQVVGRVLTGGPQVLRDIRVQMQAWMNEHEYTSLESMRGCMNILRSPNPNVFSRANYMRVLQTWVGE